MKVSITTPFSTATPDSAMKPTPAEIDIGMPLSSSASTPPVSASGTPEKTIAASFAERNSVNRSEEHTSELQSLMRLSYAVFCLKQTNQLIQRKQITTQS